MPERSDAKNFGPAGAAPGPPKSTAAETWPWLTPHTVGVLLALAAAALWSTSGLFIKVLTIDPIPLTSLRCAMAGVLLAPMLRSMRLRVERELLLLMVFYGVVSLSFITATRWSTAANAIVLQSTSPAWVFLVSCLLARRILWRFSPPIAIILIGLTVIMLEPAHGTPFLGNLLGLASGITLAGLIILYSRVKRPVVEVIVLINLVVAVALFLLQPGAFRWMEYTLSDWIMLAYLGGVQVGLGHMCFFAALKRISTTQAAILSLLEPLLNPIWVYFAVGEVPSAHLFAGGGLVLCGIAVDAWLRHNGAPQSGTAP
jgi:drug/metabolite transporter (DMT)-like permease